MEEALEPLPQPRPARFLLRAGALSLDLIVFATVSSLLRWLLGWLAAPAPVAVLLFDLVMLFAYFSLPLAVWGATPGKLAAGIEVVRADGSALRLGQAFARTAAALLSAALLGLGWFAALFTGGAALHDRLAGTRVVEPEPAGRERLWAAAGMVLALPLLAFALTWLALAEIAEEADARPDPDERPIPWDEGVKRDHARILAAWALYTGENEGRMPPDLETLVGTYLTALPELRLPDHPASDEAVLYGAEACIGEYLKGAALKDTGRWGYVADPKAPCAGTVFVDCKHLEPGGRPWYAYLETLPDEPEPDDSGP